MKAVILDYQSLAPQDLNWQALQALPIEWTFYDYTSPADTHQRVQGMDIVLSNKVVLDEALLQANTHIKQIIILATGTNNVDLTAASRLGIPVSNIVAYSTESVVQHTFACLLSLMNRIHEYDKAAKEGYWSHSQTFTLLDFQIQELAGRTLGIIGYGAIGKRVKAVAEAFGMQVVIAESFVGNAGQEGRIPLNTLLATSDVVSIHAPLSPLSRNLIDSKAISLMKKTAILLNMGRGGIVDESALLTALNAGVIKAAATDVLVQEPPALDDPLLQYNKPNLLVTPHVAWASQEARQNMLGQVESIIKGLFSQQRINPVNSL